MPELPEVETIRRDLIKNVGGRRITGVNFLWSGILKGISPDKFTGLISGRVIKDVQRRAKNLAIILDDGNALLFHMKMTGHLIVTGNDWEVDSQGRWISKDKNQSPLKDPLNQYIRVIFSLDNGKILAFSDLRKFAYVKYLDQGELVKVFEEYGPEPLTDEFSAEYLITIFAKKKLPIKKVLMDQTLIAGIGNIYADEILYDSKIHPFTKASSLTETEIRQIYKSTREILSKAVELRGTSTSDFRDTEGKKGRYGDVLKVYRRNGKPCFKDGVEIERITVGGRGTHYCPKEQVVKD